MVDGFSSGSDVGIFVNNQKERKRDGMMWSWSQGGRIHAAQTCTRQMERRKKN